MNELIQRLRDEYPGQPDSYYEQMARDLVEAYGDEDSAIEYLSTERGRVPDYPGRGLVRGANEIVEGIAGIPGAIKDFFAPDEVFPGQQAAAEGMRDRLIDKIIPLERAGPAVGALRVDIGEETLEGGLRGEPEPEPVPEELPPPPAQPVPVLDVETGRAEAPHRPVLPPAMSIGGDLPGRTGDIERERAARAGEAGLVMESQRPFERKARAFQAGVLGTLADENIPFTDTPILPEYHPARIIADQEEYSEHPIPGTEGTLLPYMLGNIATYAAGAGLATGAMNRLMPVANAAAGNRASLLSRINLGKTPGAMAAKEVARELPSAALMGAGADTPEEFAVWTGVPLGAAGLIGGAVGRSASKAAEQIRPGVAHKLSTGEIVEGKTLNDLWQRLEAEGVPRRAVFGPNAEAGYMTTQGRFVNEIEAEQIARATGQIRGESANIQGGGSVPLQEAIQDVRTNPERMADEAVAALTEKGQDGFTVNAVLGDVMERPDMGPPGTSVARTHVASGEITDVDDPALRQKLVDWIEENDHYLLDHPEKYDLGGWVDDGKFYVEIAERMSPEDAVAAGQRANQIGVFNVTTEMANQARRASWEADRSMKWLGEVDDPSMALGGPVKEFRWETPEGETLQALIGRPYEGEDLLEVKWIGAPFGTDAPDLTGKLGTRSMMEVQGDLMREFPDTRTVMFERVSGARHGEAADLSSEFADMYKSHREFDEITPAMRRLAARGAPPPPEDAFIPTGGTGEPMHPAQVFLREFDIAGPGTTGTGRALAGSVFGAAGGYMAGETPEERAQLALAGAIGGGILAGLASPERLRKAASHIRTDRGGYVYVPGLAKRVDGAVAYDPDALIRVASEEELERLLRDKRSFGTMLHHRYGRPLKPIPEEELARRTPTSWDKDAGMRTPSTGEFGGSPLTGTARRGAAGTMARPGMPRDEFIARIREQFPEMTPEEAAVEYKKSMEDYVDLLRNNVIAMENMADWDDLLTYFHAGNFILDGQRPWYMGVRETVESFLGPDMGEMFIRFLAATSANSSAVGENLGGNIGLAKKAFFQWLKGADQIRPRKKFGARSLDQAEQIIGRVVDAKEISSNALSGSRVVFAGRKLDNYYRALMGDPNAVVVDVWMARLFGFDPAQKSLSKAQFDFIERHVREIATEFEMRPVDVQSALWQGIKAHWTELGRTPAETIENYARTLERSLGEEPGFIDLAAGRWDTAAARETAKRLKEDIPKAIAGDEAAELRALNRSFQLGRQLGIGHTELMKAMVRVGGGGLIGGAVGGQAGGPEGAALGFVAGAAAGFGAPRAFSSLKEAASAYRAGRTLRAKAAQDYAEVAAKRGTGAIDAPTSGYHVNEPIDLEEFMGKINTMNLRQGTEQVMETRAQRIIRERGLPDQAQRSRSRATTRKLAREMEIDLGKMNPRKMDDVEALALRNEINVTTERLRDIENILNGGGFHTAEELEKLYQIDEALERRLGDLLEFFNQTRSQFGRNLNSLKYLADRWGNIPTFWYARAQKSLDGEVLTTEMRATIDKLVAEGDTPGLIQYINSLRRVGTPEKVNTLWKVGLLTAPTTHMANGIGNMAMMAMEASKDAPAVFYDRLLTLATGQRSKGSAFAGAKSLWRGTKSGTKGAVETFTEGIIPERLYGKYDLNFGEITFDNPIVDLYSKSVFRGLLAGDAFFRAQALERAFVDLAETYASNAGLKGAAKRARIKELLVDPPDEMVNIAIYEAEVATFMNDPAFSMIVQGVTEKTKRVGGESSRRFIKQAFDYTVPFKRTPTNVIERAFEYSPVGPLARMSDVRKLWKLVADESADPEELLRIQRRIANTFGRSTVGAFPILMGYYLASTGKLRTSWPKDQTESTAWQMTGEQENSILIGEDWYKLDRISPLGNLIILGGHAYEHMSSGDNVVDKVVGWGADKLGLPEPTGGEGEQVEDPGLSVANGLGAIGGGIRSLSEQTFLRNLSENLSALMGEGRGGSATQRIINNYARSIVPALVRRGVVGFDGKFREAETAAESFQSAILPGGSETLGIDPLPVKRDVFGEERERRDSGWAYLLNPFARKQDKTQTDETVRLLDRLGVTPSFRRPMPNESEEQFKRRVEREGQIIREMVRELQTANPTVRVRENPGDDWTYVPWADLKDEYQADVLSRGISNVRRHVSQAFKRGYLSEAPQQSSTNRSRERR